MDTLQLVVLALVQGLTEILPISSSAHLVLVPHIAGWPDQGLSFDVALHIGTAIAIIAYFRADLASDELEFCKEFELAGPEEGTP